MRQYQNLLKPHWSQEEQMILELNSAKSIRELSMFLPNRSPQAIKLRLHRIGIRRPHGTQPKNFNLTDVDIGIIAGLIEGEGSIGLLQHKIWKKEKRYLRPYIQVSNSDMEIHGFLRDKIGFGSLSGSSKIHPASNFQVVGQSAISSLLEILLPRLITSRKKKLAILVKEFCDRRLSIRRGGHGASYEERDWEIYREVRMLNKKGPASRYDSLR